jgi:hypothetical protein
MQAQHMDPAEAYQAFLDLRAQHMIAMHWGTFDLTDEPADRAPRVLAEAVRAAGGDASRTVVMAIGEQWLRAPTRIPARLLTAPSADCSSARRLHARRRRGFTESRRQQRAVGTAIRAGCGQVPVLARRRQVEFPPSGERVVAQDPAAPPASTLRRVRATNRSLEDRASD